MADAKAGRTFARHSPIGKMIVATGGLNQKEKGEMQGPNEKEKEKESRDMNYWPKLVASLATGWVTKRQTASKQVHPNLPLREREEDSSEKEKEKEKVGQAREQPPRRDPIPGQRIDHTRLPFSW